MDAQKSAADITIDYNFKAPALPKSEINWAYGLKEYEKNDITINGGEIFINGKLADSYTFKQDYYWMMGDNRHNSEDARYWGYVPFDHVVGKPVFIWFSWDTNGEGIANKIRWDRVFTTVHGEGKPVSYLYYFIGALVLWFGFSTYRKRKKGA